MTRSTTKTLITIGLLALLPIAAGIDTSNSDSVTSASEPTATASPHWLDVLGDVPADTDPVTLARLITEAQAAVGGHVLEARPDGATPAPSASVLRLAPAEAMDADALAALIVLDTAPAPLRDALAALLADFVWYDQVTRDAVAVIDPAAVDLRNPDPTLHVPLGGIMAAQNALLADADRLFDVLRDTDARLAAPVSIANTMFLALDGVCNDDVYEQDLPLIIDECGDDTYRNNAGGGHTIVCPSSQDPNNVVPAAALFDHLGDDQYLSGRNCGINGGGALGAGLLHDEAGNDAYLIPTEASWNHGNDGVNGGGVLGSGVILDEAGDDVYTAGGWGTNGGGYISGRGLLLDDAGNDWYRATTDAVNGGGAAGVGGLVDNGGRDWYEEPFHPDHTGFDISVVPKTAIGAQMDRA